MHEFEALLFSDTAAFAEAFPGQTAVLRELAAIRAAFPDPEAIDNSPQTAPSKRILRLLPNYQKPVAGLLIAQKNWA